MSKKHKKKDEYKQKYIDYCRRLVFENQKRADEILLTVSFSALGLFFAFVEKIGLPFNCVSWIFFYLTIIGFLLTVICDFLSFIFQAKFITDRIIKYEQTNKYNFSKNILNTIAICSFVASLIFLVIYLLIIFHNKGV